MKHQKEVVKKVIDYIEKNLEKEIDLDANSGSSDHAFR